MSDKKKSGTFGKALKLFLLIVLVLLVPMVMDQVEVDPETVRTVGRVAVGVGGLMLLYGIFSKLMKGIAFVALALLAGVALVSEGAVKAPRVFGSGSR